MKQAESHHQDFGQGVAGLMHINEVPRQPPTPFAVTPSTFTSSTPTPLQYPILHARPRSFVPESRRLERYFWGREVSALPSP